MNKLSVSRSETDVRCQSRRVVRAPIQWVIPIKLFGHSVFAFTLVALLQACAANSTSQRTTIPANLGDLKTELRAYHDSGRYDRDIATVDAEATAYIVKHASESTKPAIVLDIDETALSNWQEIEANDFGYITDGDCNHLPRGPCGALSWDQLGNAPAIKSTRELFQVAKNNRAAVFFITGRYEKERDVTVKNLRAAGYRDWDGLIMRPDGSHTKSAADFKAPQRQLITAEGYTIVANIGDQPSDLAGGYALRAFLLPDPFYRVR
jgi:predicted secreted acid phosphatase